MRKGEESPIDRLNLGPLSPEQADLLLDDLPEERVKMTEDELRRKTEDWERWSCDFNKAFTLVLVRDKWGQCAILRRADSGKGPHLDRTINLYGGKIEAEDETVQAAARRELLEETGLETISLRPFAIVFIKKQGNWLIYFDAMTDNVYNINPAGREGYAIAGRLSDIGIMAALEVGSGNSGITTGTVKALNLWSNGWETIWFGEQEDDLSKLQIVEFPDAVKEELMSKFLKNIANKVQVKND